MRALCLTTRFRQDAYEGEASLLVYDEYEFTESTLSEDVRNIFDERPATANIYVLAPFEAEDKLIEVIKGGVAVQRARPYFEGIGGKIRLLSLERGSNETVRICAIPFEYVDGEVKTGERMTLHERLGSGWLFDLFHRGGGLVEAPIGVHFGKLSGRHTNKFLRASGPLLTSEACAAVAFFALGASSGLAPSRIFVDTAPLISVAFAMARIAVVRNLWTNHPPVRSFSSYGGVENLPRRRPSDLYLISASTSGGLAGKLRDHQIEDSRIITLFYLESGAAPYEGVVVCHLTYQQDGLHGYSSVSSFTAKDCPFCKNGYFLAQLEGDQFLLEKRAVKRLIVRSQSQPLDARKAAERLARTRAADVALFPSSSHQGGVRINAEMFFDADKVQREDFIRMLRRFTPTPLNYVVLVELSEAKFLELAKEAGIEDVVQIATVVTDVRQTLPSIQDGAALVVFGCLSNHAYAREINAKMRTVVPGGSVAYLSAITIAESSQALSELEMFLSYGERGRDTFTFRSALQFMLPVPRADETPWQAERGKLLRMKEKKPLSPELAARLSELGESPNSADKLFFSGDRARLEIARDFVYLDTEKHREQISQADVYAVVENILACCRANNNGLASKGKKDGITGWTSSVYAHLLVCPSNFQIYNDAILRAAFLRAASPSELLYSTDEECSTEMLNIILAEAEAWNDGGGASLPEFLLALAMGRMRLVKSHREELCARLKQRDLPAYLRDLADEVEGSQMLY